MRIVGARCWSGVDWEEEGREGIRGALYDESRRGVGGLLPPIALRHAQGIHKVDCEERDVTRCRDEIR